MTVQSYGKYYKTIVYYYKVLSAIASVSNYDCKCDATIGSINL